VKRAGSDGALVWVQLNTAAKLREAFARMLRELGQHLLEQRPKI
jgi:hypothetical protein